MTIGSAGRVAVVTGAAGHIGTNLCLALLADGYEVRAVDLREPARAVHHGARWIRADIRDPAEVGPALDGCEIVYHLAAVISVAGGLRGLVHSVNVDGVRILASAALERGVPRFVHCSSVHAFDVAALHGRLADEASPRALRPELPAYDRSKAAGEVELRRLIDRGLDAVVVNPSGVLGPVDDGPSRMGSVLLALWRRRLPALVSGGFDWVDVRDVVRAIRAAGARGRTGESYLVPGHRVSVGEMARLAASVRPGGVSARTAPLRLALAVAPVAELVVRRTGWPLLPTREALHALESFPRVDGSKAQRELGHEARPFAATLADLHAYFVQTGRLRAVSALE